MYYTLPPIIFFEEHADSSFSVFFSILGRELYGLGYRIYCNELLPIPVEEIILFNENSLLEDTNYPPELYEMVRRTRINQLSTLRTAQKYSYDIRAMGNYDLEKLQAAKPDDMNVLELTDLNYAKKIREYAAEYQGGVIAQVGMGHYGIQNLMDSDRIIWLIGLMHRMDGQIIYEHTACNMVCNYPKGVRIVNVDIPGDTWKEGIIQLIKSRISLSNSSKSFCVVS